MLHVDVVILSIYHQDHDMIPFCTFLEKNNKKRTDKNRILAIPHCAECQIPSVVHKKLRETTTNKLIFFLSSHFVQ